MSTHFFTNQEGNSLLKKFRGVFEKVSNLYVFHAVVGYFRASGYFEIRDHLLKLGEVKILVGINVDHLVADAKRRGLLYMGDPIKTREEFIKAMQADIKEARYAREVEDGILHFMEDLIDRKIEIRAHQSKNLHAKIYVFLPESYDSDSDGRVITGSSNLTNAGLGGNNDEGNYEFNVELRRYDDVAFAESEFQRLWDEGEEILPEDVQIAKKKTHLEKEFTPFEIYIKFLIEYFGRNIDYDPETVGDVPKQFKKLSYQIDAVNQGYNMLMDYNGFFLADVVGTGKTVVAAMLAKRFIIANGTGNTKILVVYPPALEKNWKRTFSLFGIDKYAKFVTNGSLHKIIDGDINYWAKEDYDLVIVDEAHKFRNRTAQSFDQLQIICKAGRLNNGLIESDEKKVILVSATPLNNRPEDIYNMLQLFQDTRRSALPVRNLTTFFHPHIYRYKELMKLPEPDLQVIRDMYKKIREKVLKPITIRRTRRDLENVEQYKTDLREQNIVFPDIAPPTKREYKLDPNLSKLFFETLDAITDEKKIDYFRYRAISLLHDDIKKEFYEIADLTSAQLARMMSTLLVKRLESSFKAFKDSLKKLRDSTANMIRTYEDGKVFIAPDLDVNQMMMDGFTDDEIEMRILELSDLKEDNRTFASGDFKEGFIEGLRKDLDTLEALWAQWDEVDYDPKLETFMQMLNSDLFDRSINPSGKLVVFSEAKSTTDYLFNALKKRGFSKVLNISAENRGRQFETILANFDANYEKEHKNEYDILLTTEVLAEGVNLHRANVIVNYDTPWNATKLMQRIGRVNRIGTQADTIYNFNFYPSDEGDQIISLKKRALVKLQSFHSAYGEDSQIFSLDEVIEQFELYKAGTEEDEDIRLKYLEFIRNFKDNNQEDFRRIRRLPLKARCGRDIKSPLIGGSICFLQAGDHKELFEITESGEVNALNFDEAVSRFEALEKEQPVKLPDWHYKQIEQAKNQYSYNVTNSIPEMAITDKRDARFNKIMSFLRDLNRIVDSDPMTDAYNRLSALMEKGTYANLIGEVAKIEKQKKKLKPTELEKLVINLANKYTSRISRDDRSEQEPQTLIFEPEIIISESFIN